MDLTVEAFVVYEHRVLLIDHTQLQTWLPVGGHIELDEEPEQALFREIREERGLEGDLWSQKPAQQLEGKKFLYPAQKLQIVVDHAGESTSVKPSLAALLRKLAISRSRARCSSSAALKSRHGSRCRRRW
jgi:8-oxo-dGTP pyrophosphatase MutT (NUDIX family)